MASRRISTAGCVTLLGTNESSVEDALAQRRASEPSGRIEADVSHACEQRVPGCASAETLNGRFIDKEVFQNQRIHLAFGEGIEGVG
jgi:hypothetical protein